jgi:hypothetical protein
MCLKKGNLVLVFYQKKSIIGGFYQTQIKKGQNPFYKEQYSFSDGTPNQLLKIFFTISQNLFKF